MVFELHIQAEYSNICMGNYHFSTRQGIFLYRCVVAISVFIGRASVQNTQSGEISATLAETECSVSSVGVQSKGPFKCFL